MAIRLKNFSTNLVTKVLIFILLLASIITCARSLSVLLPPYETGRDAFTAYTKSFKSNDQLAGNLKNYADLYYDLNYNYESDEEIEKGSFITTDMMAEKISQKFSEWAQISNDEYQIHYDKEEENYSILFNVPDDQEAVTKDRRSAFRTYMRDIYSEQQIMESIKVDRAEQKNQIMEELSHYTDFEMVIIPKSDYDNANTLAKTFQNYPIYYIQKEGFGESNNNYLKKNLYLKGNDYYFVGIDQTNYNGLEKKWNTDRKQFLVSIVCLVIAFMVSVICFAFLCTVIGRKKDDDGIIMNPVDNIWTELQLLAAVGGIVLLAYRYMDHPAYAYMRALTEVVGWTILLLVVLMQVKRIKKQECLNGFLIVKLFKKAKEGLLAFWNGGPRITKVTVLAIAIPIISATIVGAFVLIPILLYVSYKYIKNLESVMEGVKKVKEGQLDYRIEVKQKGDLKELAEDINSISEGLKNAVASEVRSERLKSELLSNVSHDIKTPLTSVITYVDLLKNESIDNDIANEFIEIIDRKSQRLKVLTSDLFEAAKATSGDMPVDIQAVDFNAFIMQGVGEFEDKISEADLEVRISLAKEPVIIMADGNLLWRVFQNLMSNVVKYAMPGSRIYLELSTTNQYAVFEIKNISAYELNIPAAELMERFQRGDKSRSTDGSGLGLSIARSLLELQNGIFKIDIDGDLFKVTLKMELYGNQV